MPNLYIEAPQDTPPPSDAIDWTPISHRFEAADGSAWDLSTGVSGVYFMAGVRGMDMPPIVHYKQKSPAVAGAFWRGAIVDERQVFWPLTVYSNDGSQAWINHNRKLSRALLNPMVTTRWFVTQPGGETRWLDIRFEDGGQYAWGGEDPDPELMGWAKYGYTFNAEKPYWRGDPIQLLWTSETPTDFLTVSAGNVITISSNNAVYGAQIYNPGSVPTWPVWTVYGPATLVTVGVGSDAITIPITLAADQFVTIDTDPTERVLTNHAGTDVTSQMTLTGDGFAEVPPGDLASLAVSMTGTGTVAVLIRPAYYTATAH